MRIDNLVKNLEQNTAKQAEILEQQLQSVTEQHLQSYKDLLTANRQETERYLTETAPTLQKMLGGVLTVGMVFGMLLAMLAFLAGLNWWQYNKLQDKKAEIANIKAVQAQTPLNFRVLARTHISEDANWDYIITQGGTVETYKNQKGDTVLRIKK